MVPAHFGPAQTLSVAWKIPFLSFPFLSFPSFPISILIILPSSSVESKKTKPFINRIFSLLRAALSIPSDLLVGSDTRPTVACIHAPASAALPWCHGGSADEDYEEDREPRGSADDRYLLPPLPPAVAYSLFIFFVDEEDAKMALGGTAPPRGSAAATASLRRRRTSSAGASGGAAGTMLQFYTDDAPGLKISPNVVLIMSIGFIAFVAVLHVMGKLYFVRR
ncbi:hypothetical protein CRG98_025512 [Punica granatum]|uniref:Protein transport protein Sec61 subunit beta n=2 Tax=Punica granatum TaxID=22663 RepID=A0A2I0JEK1_PUNGR|nr:hypothetical protein CRG98_025512 [Punica granatum]